jgi:hypothetical protein
MLCGAWHHAAWLGGGRAGEQFHAQRAAVMELAHLARRLRRSLVEPLFVVQATP